MLKERSFELEKGAGVESAVAVLLEDFICKTEAIGTDEPLLVGIPEEEVEVVGVKAVEIDVFSGALTHQSEGDFPLASDFLEKMRDV
jgi:hypothetical protein